MLRAFENHIGYFLLSYMAEFCNLFADHVRLTVTFPAPNPLP